MFLSNQRLRRCLPLLGLFLFCACGGKGTFIAPPAGPTEVRIDGGQVALTLDPQGRLTDVRVPPADGNLAAPEPEPILELDVAGSTHGIETLGRTGSTLTATFDGGRASVRLGIEETPHYVLFRVLAVEPAEATALRLRLTFKRLGSVDPSLNGTYDADTVLCLRSTNAITRCIYRSLPGAVPQTGVEWTSEHGLVGGAAALIGTSRTSFFDAMGTLQLAEGLPSPRFDGRVARDSPSARTSYLFLTYYQPGDLPALLEYAKVGGFGLILVLRGLWRKSAGTYALDPARWPGGMPEFQAFCDEIRNAGLGVGLHFYGPSISLDDPLVTPTPHDGLLSWPCPPLANGLEPNATTITCTETPDLPPASGGGFPGRYLRIGDEIVRYTAKDEGPPYTFTDCERGALGTTATAHAAGVQPLHLATLNDLFLIDPDSDLVQTVASNLADIVNAADIDMVYFDGSALVPTDEFVQRWYYMNRLLPAYDTAFDHSVLVQTGLGPGRELDWHLVPRSASADGHGDIKWFLDQRTPSIESIRRGFTVPDVGWYGFDAGRPPDHLEYICARCLGWDCGLSVQTFRIELENDERARETMEIIGRYERCKRAGVLPDDVRAALLEPQRDFRLLEGATDDWHLFAADYDAPRDVRTLIDGTSAWTTFNGEDAARTLGIEITRGRAIQVDADWSDPGVAVLETFRDPAPYTPDVENDSARLVHRVEHTMNAAGPARAGVEHTFNLVQDPSVGGPCLELAATNTNNRIGWCAVGRDFAPKLEVTSTGALGLWLKGDKSGVEVSLELYDEQDRRAVFKLPVYFEGWRFHTLRFTSPAGFDRSKVKYLVLVVDDLAPERSIALRFALLRGTPAVRAPADLTDVSISIDGRSIVLPVPLPPGGTARVDALGRLTIWAGGMQEGLTFDLAEGPVSVTPGNHPVVFEAADPTPYPGDVAVRLSRLDALFPR